MDVKMDRLSRKLMDLKGLSFLFWRAKTVKPERYGINTLKTSKDYSYCSFFWGVVFSKWPMLDVFPKEKRFALKFLKKIDSQSSVHSAFNKDSFSP